METDSALLRPPLRSGSPRLEIRRHGFQVEVVDSNGDVVYFTCGLALTKDQKLFSKPYLVIPSAFANRGVKNTLIEISRALQIADVQINVIDTVSLKPCRRQFA